MDFHLIKSISNEKINENFIFLSSRLLLQWVQDGSPSHSTPIKVESPNQFVPLGTSKKEFKRVQQAVSYMTIIEYICIEIDKQMAKVR